MESPCGSSLNFLMALEKTSHYCSFILSLDLVITWVVPVFGVLGPGYCTSLLHVFLQKFATPVILESCHSLSHQLRTNAQGDLRRCLGQPSAMTWRLPRSGGSFGFSLPHFLSLIFVEFDYSFSWLPWPPPSSSLCSCSKL